MANKLGDAGITDHFGLVFQYQIKNIIIKNGQKQSQIKNTISMLKLANTSAIWHTPPTKVLIS